MLLLDPCIPLTPAGYPVLQGTTDFQILTLCFQPLTLGLQNARWLGMLTAVHILCFLLGDSWISSHRCFFLLLLIVVLLVCLVKRWKLLKKAVLNGHTMLLILPYSSLQIQNWALILFLSVSARQKIARCFHTVCKVKLESKFTSLGDTYFIIN